MNLNGKSCEKVTSQPKLTTPPVEQEDEGNVGKNYYLSVKPSSVKPPSERHLDSATVQLRMKEVLDATAQSLEDKLNRMISENGGEETARYLDEAIQSTSFASHLSGRCRMHAKSVLCDCRCSSPATPNVDQNPGKVKVKIVFQNKRNVASTPNLLKERSIRSQMMKDGGKECRCTKSELSNKCSEYTADKIIKPINNPTQNIGLLVDQDAEYTDGYLELLAKEQTGTQTELSDVESEVSIEIIPKTKMPPRCTCFKNIEMPWDEISYNPTRKKPPKQPQEQRRTSMKKSDKSITRVRELTVTSMNKESLENLRQSIISEARDGKEDEIIVEVKKETAPPVVSGQSSHNSTEPPDEVKIKKEFIPPKRMETQVYEPPCERHNEPYMDRMYAYFPDSCDEMDPCPSNVEMPWHSILVPKHCMIRKSYRPQKTCSKKSPSCKSTCSSKSSCRSDSSESSNPPKQCMVRKSRRPQEICSKKSVRCKSSSSSKSGSRSGSSNKSIRTKKRAGTKKKKRKPSSKSILEITISYPQLTSRLFPVQNSARSQISICTSISSVAHKPKRVQKSCKLRGCISQPFSSKTVSIKSSGDLKNKKSKCPCARSMPSISSKASVASKSCDINKGKGKSDRIAELLESCKREMEPIKDGINKLRARIRELNLPDISSYQECPQRPGNQGYPSGHFACIPSFASLADPRYPLYMASWPPYMPYMPPPPPPAMHPYYYCPGSMHTQTRSVTMKVSKSKSTKTKSSESYVLCSEGEDELFIDSQNLNQQTCHCKKTKQNEKVTPKPSKISKPFENKCVCSKSTAKLIDNKMNDERSYDSSCGSDRLNVDSKDVTGTNGPVCNCKNKIDPKKPLKLTENNTSCVPENDGCCGSDKLNVCFKSEGASRTDTAITGKVVPLCCCKSKINPKEPLKLTENKTNGVLENDGSCGTGKLNVCFKSEAASRTDTTCGSTVKICQSTNTDFFTSTFCKCAISQSEICPATTTKTIKYNSRRIIIGPRGGYFSDATTASVSTLEPDEPTCNNTTCKAAATQKKIITIDVCKVSNKNRADINDRPVGKQSSTITIRRPYCRGLSITFSRTKTSAKNANDPVGGPSTK